MSLTRSTSTTAMIPAARRHLVHFGSCCGSRHSGSMVCPCAL